MSDWTLWAADVVVLSGLAALTLTVSALLRMPDPLIQVHAAAKGVVLGVLAVLASSVFAASWPVVLQSLVVAVFVLPTSAVASHALVRLHVFESGTDPERPPEGPGMARPSPGEGGTGMGGSREPR